MIRTILSSLYSRVFVAYKTTFLGLGLVAADVLVTTLQAATLPTWAHTVVGIAASLLALYKGHAKPAPLTPVP
jgi:hypothetical protein